MADVFPVPLRSTGFILEGFPQSPEEVTYLLQRQLFPDLALVLAVDLHHVVKYLLPPRLQAWSQQRQRRRHQLQLTRELRLQQQVSQQQGLSLGLDWGGEGGGQVEDRWRVGWRTGGG